MRCQCKEIGWRRGNEGELTQGIREEGASDGASCKPARRAHHHLLVVALLVLRVSVSIAISISVGLVVAVAVPTTVSAGLVMAVAGGVSAMAVLTVSTLSVPGGMSTKTTVTTALRVVDGPLPLSAGGRGLGVEVAARAVVPLRYPAMRQRGKAFGHGGRSRRRGSAPIATTTMLLFMRRPSITLVRGWRSVSLVRRGRSVALVRRGRLVLLRRGSSVLLVGVGRVGLIAGLPCAPKMRQ